MNVLGRFAETLIDTSAGTQEKINGMLPALVLDVLGAWFAGRGSDEGRRLKVAYESTMGESCLDRVAYAVGVTRSTELDDIHLGSCITAGAVIVPAVLLMQRSLRAPVQRIGRAIAAGYDAMIRFGEAVHGPDILFQGIWPTYLAAPLGTAAAVASLLDLDKSGMANSLALALAQVSGAAGGHAAGNNARWLLLGQAARSGSFAAIAAHRGFVADTSLLDTDWLARTHGLAVDTAPLLHALPSGSLAEISRKPHCGAKQTMAALEAFRILLADGLDPGRIKQIRVFVPSAYRNMISQSPLDRTGRIVSIAYQIALATYHPVQLFDIDRQHIDDPRMERLTNLVEVLIDAQLDRVYPHHWPGRVEIDILGGGTARCLVEAAYGDPARPLSASDQQTKFDLLTLAALDSERASEVKKLCSDVVANPAALESLGALFEESEDEQ